MILVLDNYDSFTFNLVQYIGENTADIEVVRNDKATVEELLEKKPSHIIISPGPCTPKEAGISVELVRRLERPIPLLGVCLGHQCIAAAFGGEVIRAPYLMHGKVSRIICKSSPLLNGISDTFIATRYHSLIVKRENLPRELEITAETEDGIIMAVQHRSRLIFGLQFHPESILTEPGKQIIKNFLNLGDKL
ncbi:anthranilate synthase component II [Fibrobacterota bacterium]